MKNSKIVYVCIAGIGFGFIMIGSIVFINSIFPLVIGAIILLVSIIMLMLYTSFDLFRRDKEIDLDSLQKQGLTVIECVNCSKKNVLEDKYCIFCGERLVEVDE